MLERGVQLEGLDDTIRFRNLVPIDQTTGEFRLDFLLLSLNSSLIAIIKGGTSDYNGCCYQMKKLIRHLKGGEEAAKKRHIVVVFLFLQMQYFSTIILGRGLNVPLFSKLCKSWFTFFLEWYPRYFGIDKERVGERMSNPLNFGIVFVRQIFLRAILLVERRRFSNSLIFRVRYFCPLGLSSTSTNNGVDFVFEPGYPVPGVPEDF